MGSVAQAVREFDEAVQVPWRPPLAATPSLRVVPGGGSPPRSRAHAARVARSGVPGPTPRAEVSPVRRAVLVRAPRPTERACSRCASGRTCSGSLRLTRRARRLVAVLVLSGAVAVGTVLGNVSQQDDGLRLAGDGSTVVRAGDTLWSIARSVAGEADVRAVVDEIQRLNGLEGTALVPGQVLQLP